MITIVRRKGKLTKIVPLSKQENSVEIGALRRLINPPKKEEVIITNDCNVLTLEDYYALVAW